MALQENKLTRNNLYEVLKFQIKAVYFPLQNWFQFHYNLYEYPKNKFKLLTQYLIQ